jgi:hypothetical protein
MRQIVLDVGVLRIELARALMEVVAAFGDGEGDDPGFGRSHFLQNAFPVVWPVQEIQCRTDHTGLIALRTSLHHGVQVVLRLQNVPHPGVVGQQADPAKAVCSMLLML